MVLVMVVFSIIQIVSGPKVELLHQRLPVNQQFHCHQVQLSSLAMPRSILVIIPATEHSFDEFEADLF